MDSRPGAGDARRWNSAGHAGALFDDELYEVLPKTRGGYQRVQESGVRFGYDRVVLYLEPRLDERERLETNTAQTHLLIDNGPLPWGRWAEEFRAAMPADIQRLQERIARDTGGATRREAIRARLRAHGSLYRLSQFRQTRPRPPVHRRAGNREPEQSARPRLGGAVARQELPPDAEPAACRDRAAQPTEDELEEHLPDVAWVSVRDGTRAPGELEDRAARYHRARNQLRSTPTSGSSQT